MTFLARSSASARPARSLDPDEDNHMHEATLTIVGDDRIEINGCRLENGAAAAEMCCKFKLGRKK